MARGVLFKLFLTALLIAVIASTAFSARKAPERLLYNPLIRMIVDVALAPESNPAVTDYVAAEGDFPRASLGSAAVPSTSPGVIIGNTYFDNQAYNYQGRMIRTGRNFDLGLNDSLTLVHFGFQNLSVPNNFIGQNDRGPAYAYYEAAAGVYQFEVSLTFPPQFAGYINLEVTKQNQAIVCGHYTPDDVQQVKLTPTAWYDDAPGDGGFSMRRSVDSALWKYANPYVGENRNTLFPHIAFQQRPTGEHITHMTGLTFASGTGGNILYYFRKEGNTAALNLGQLSSCPSLSVTGWDCPWVVDTPHVAVGGIEASKQSGKVALFWINHPPDYTLTPGCDTCSVNDTLPGIRNRFENDMYYQVSDNYGVSWNSMQNVTHNDAATADWMPFADIDGLWDAADEFHLAWVASDWKRYRTDSLLGYGSRIFHWTQDFGNATSDVNAGTSRTVMQRLKDPITCNAGPFDLNLAKINLAQCNGHLYITAVDLWDGHNDPLNPDCSQRGYDGDGAEAVNGEIMVGISDDNGVTWDLPHNLTSSWAPKCDSSSGINGPCACEHWPSMTPRGIVTRSGDDWSGATKVNPRPAQSYPDVVDAEWLDIQYVQDLDPGRVAAGAIPAGGHGTWKNSPIRHFRLACVAPDQVPVPVYSISEIGWPTYVKPGQQKDVEVLIENIGNISTTVSVSKQQDSGPTDWLTFNGFALSIGEGINNKDTGNIHLSAVGLASDKVDQAGGTVILSGRVLFTHQGPSSVDSIPVTLIVTDTIRLPDWDTIHTGVISLAIATNGQYGGGGDAGMSNVRMDFYDDPLECDKDTLGAKLGDTRYYLGDGSFAVGGIVGGDTIMANQIFSQGLSEKRSVYQTAGHAPPVTAGVLSTWASGKLVNSDSSIAFAVKWVAPQVTQTWGTAAGKTWHADQNFVTRELKIWSNDGTAHNGLAIGDVADWEIPADSGSDNTGKVDATSRLLYQVGGEYNQDNATECQNNNTRYGGMAFGYLKTYWDHDTSGTSAKKWTIRDSVGYGGYIEANSRYVYPGWQVSELYANMENASGYIPWTHSDPDSIQTDLHSVITAAFDYDLAVGDTVAFYTVYASVRQDVSAGADRIKELATKGRNFTYYFTCCRGFSGDLNGDGAESDVVDLVFAIDRIFRGGGPATCPGEADVNRDKTPLDILDMIFLVDRIFRGGQAPPACSIAPTP